MHANQSRAIQLLQKKLQKHEAFLIEDPDDLFYFLKKSISLGSLLIEQDQLHLFVDGRYFSAFSHLSGLVTKPSEHDGLKTYLKTSGLEKIYFDSAKTSFEKGLHLTKSLTPQFLGLPHLTKQCRIIKSSDEIALIEQSTRLLVSIYQEFLKLPKIGLSEKQIATQFKLLSLEMGADGFSFEPIIATGPNGAFPHHRPKDRVLEPHDVMLVDVGVTKNGYQSDMTRMVFFGHAPEELIHLHDLVLDAHQAALKLCKPGVACKELDLAAREVFKKAGVEDLFVHSLGHGLGIETHEAPRLKFDGSDKDVILEKGMVITIEPGLYKEGLGGIRHEDLIVITEDGYKNFYPNYL